MLSGLGGMERVGFVLGSLSPMLFWALRAMIFRGLSAGFRLILDLALFLVSVPFGIWLIGWALKFPDNPGDHSPGIGVVFIYLILVWIVCVLIWLFRLAEFTLRKLMTKP